MFVIIRFINDMPDGIFHALLYYSPTLLGAHSTYNNHVLVDLLTVEKIACDEMFGSKSVSIAYSRGYGDRKYSVTDVQACRRKSQMYDSRPRSIKYDAFTYHDKITRHNCVCHKVRGRGHGGGRRYPILLLVIYV